MTPRARPLPAQDRRDALVAVTVPLLLAHGRAVSTRQIAEAAGVAEGTIFRVFDSKEALIDAALASAFDPRPFLDDLAGIDPHLPFRDRMVAMVALLQDRFVAIFDLMASIGMVAPPDHRHLGPDGEDWRAEGERRMLALVGDQAPISVPPERLILVLRLLTFSGSHSQISHGNVLTPAEIVDSVLYGLAQEDSRC